MVDNICSVGALGMRRKEVSEKYFKIYSYFIEKCPPPPAKKKKQPKKQDLQNNFDKITL